MKEQTPYLIGGAVLLAVVAYFVLRPGAVFAQAPAPTPTPRLPGPGEPPPPASRYEFPVQSSIQAPEPILAEDGDIEFFLKKRTVAEAPASANPATWQGFDRQGLRVGSMWYNLKWISNWHPTAVVSPRGEAVLWTPPDGPLSQFT